jgi:uncharacterized protein YjbI with pentapeptide repeats
MDRGAKSVDNFFAPSTFQKRNMLMPRKPALLLHLLNLALRPIAGQTKASPKQLVVLPQQPPAHDREAWRIYWQAQGQPWRTEPEIDRERQRELAVRRAIVPDIEHGIYPFKDIKLSRADVEWLLATHENGRGPVDWNDESQRKREGLDLRGADLRYVNLSRLPLAAVRGGIDMHEWFNYLSPDLRAKAAVHLEKAYLDEAHLEGASLRHAYLESAYLRGVHLEQATLYRAHLEGAYLVKGCLEETDLRLAHLEEASLHSAHLEGAYLGGAYLEQADLRGAHLEGTDLRGAVFDTVTKLENVILGNEKWGFPLFEGVHWQGANLSVVEWSQVKMLGDEDRAQRKSKDGRKKTITEKLGEYGKAVRANRQLAVAFQEQGLNEDAARFAYRAQVLQKNVFRLQILQLRSPLRHRMRALGAWLFSWFLFLLAGYGYRLWRSFLTYVLVIIGFTTIYYLLGASFKPPLSLVNALGLSMTSFHGRGFFPGVTQLNDTLTILASIEAFVGLVLEAAFIATLTQRFFGK